MLELEVSKKTKISKLVNYISRKSLELDKNWEQRMKIYRMYLKGYTMKFIWSKFWITKQAVNISIDLWCKEHDKLWN